MSNMLAIKVDDVTKVYKLYFSQRDRLIDISGLTKLGIRLKKQPTNFKALDRFTLEILRGQRVGVIGRNGAGKTTLLKLICGNFSPTSGRVEINGKVQALMTVGLGFHPEYTGRENIASALQYNELTDSEYQDATESIVNFCELGDFIDQPFKSYSLGMQSRLQFACATAVKPDILVIDEILGAGDAYFSSKSTKRMEELTESGATLIVVSHSMSQILQFCDRVIWIDNGKIRMDGAPREVVGAYEVFASHLSRMQSNRKTNLTVETSSGDSNDVNAIRDSIEKFRWASDPGPKLKSIRILDSVGRQTNIIDELQEINVELIIRNESDSTKRAIFYINIISEKGERISRIVSEAYDFEPDQTNKLLVSLAPCLIGAGKYCINFLSVPANSMDTGMPTKRFDLVSRFSDFEVCKILDYREPAVFYHPAQWELRIEE